MTTTLPSAAYRTKKIIQSNKLMGSNKITCSHRNNKLMGNNKRTIT